MALENILFILVAEELACEEMLTGLSILQNFLVDSHTLLEDNLATLDNRNCKDIVNKIARGNIGSIGWMMIDRLNSATDSEVV